MFEKLTEKLDSFLEMGIPGYDCAVYHKGQCVYRRFNGYSDTVNKIPINGKEIYNIYSCSKVITCTAALILYEKGLFKLDDKLSKYMSEFEEMYVKTAEGIRKAEKSITIKELFCMTAGFSYNLNSPMIQKCKEETNGRCQTREFMKYLAKEPLLFEPGERWEYSLCHDVLAALVEVISGERFGKFVEKNIFIPLAMQNSTFLIDNSQIEKVSTQYSYNTESNKYEIIPKTIDYKFGSKYESGGAGCISTVDDYIKFLEGLRCGKLIKNDTINLMSKNQLTEEQIKTFYLPEYGYGLGVRCPKGNDDITDFGWDGAAGAHAVVDKINAITAFYVQHVLNSPVQLIRNQLTRIIKESII